MEFKICKDHEELTQETSSWCHNKVQATGAKSLYLPAGNTPVPIYKEWTQRPPLFLQKLSLIQIDDIITGPKAGIFKSFFLQNLPGHESQFRWIGDQYDQGDLSILGLGINGHIAFHEPELPKDFYSGCVHLSEKTCQSLGVDASTWGVTYGASAFLKSKAILMLVLGEAKREVLQRLINKDPSLPATALCYHSDFTILADHGASGR